MSKNAIERATVDHAGLDAAAFERQVVGDVEIATGGKIFAGARDGQREDAGWQFDAVRAGECVAFLDGRAKAAMAIHRIGAEAVAGVGVLRVRGRVHLERFRACLRNGHEQNHDDR